MVYCAAQSTLLGAAAYLHFSVDGSRASRLLTAHCFAAWIAAIRLAAVIPLVESICNTCNEHMLEGYDWCLSCLCLFGVSKSPRQGPHSSLARAAFPCNDRHAQCAATYTLNAQHLQLCLLLQCCCMNNDKSANDIYIIAIVCQPRALARKIQETLKLELGVLPIKCASCIHTNHSRRVQLRQVGRLNCQHQILAMLMFNAQMLCKHVTQGKPTI